MNAARSVLLMLMTACIPALAQETQRPEFAPLLYVTFDGNANAIAPDGQVTMTGGERLNYVDGIAGQAAAFGEGDCVEYHNLPALDPKSGTIEVWVKPDFENSDTEDHYYLRLLDEEGNPSVDLNFAAVHCGPRVVFTAAGKETNCHADFSSLAGKGNHLVVTWDHYDRDLWNLRLYLNGVVRAYMDFTEFKPPTTLRVGCKSTTEATNAKAVIDEIGLYNRALSEMQVLALYNSAATGMAKVAAIREQVAADEAEAARRLEAFRNQKHFGMVVGRTISGWNDSSFGDHFGIQVPDRIDEKAVETTDLSRYDVLLFPGGGGFGLTDAGAEALRKYVREGGGFVGICAGCYAALAYKLVEREQYQFRERGSVEVSLRPSPVTEGYNPQRQLALSHANGPLMQAGDPSEDVIVYKVGNPGYACAVALHYGEGRVVAFSAHPEATSETWRIVRNALFWAAKVTDNG